MTEQFRKWDLRTVLQAGMFAMAVTGILGAVIGSYVATTVRLAEYDLRLTTLEHGREEDRKETQAYQEEMRVAVAHAVDLLTDVRLQIARQGGRHGN